MLLMMLCITSYTFAIIPNVSIIFSQMSDESSLNNIAQLLKANVVQTAELKSIFYNTNQLANSNRKGDLEHYSTEILEYNLNSIKAILTNSQYRKYVAFINKSIKDF